MNTSLLTADSSSRRARRAQAGFTIVELLIVLGVIAVLAIVGLPAVQNIMMEGRAPEVAKEVQRFVVKATNARQAGGSWATASNTELAATLVGSSILKVTTGATPSITHDLNKAGDVGSITFAPGNIAAAGDSGAVTLVKIDGAPCPIVLNSLAKLAHTLSVNGTNVKTTAQAYDGGTAQATCTDTNNTIVLQFR